MNKVKNMSKAELIAQNVENLSKAEIEFIYDFINLPKFTNKHELIKFAKGEPKNYDTAYPMEYFKEIEQIYPNMAKGNFIYDYTNNEFGRLLNINDLVIERLLSAKNKRASNL